MRLNCVFGTRTTFDLLLWWCADTSSCSRICWPTSSKSNLHLEVLSGNLTFLYKCTSFAGNLSAQASSVKRSCFSPPLLQRATAGLGITGRSDTIILQSNWHNQRLHKSYRHSQAPGRPLRWQFHGSPPECYLPISREWQIQRAGPPHCHTDRSCCGGLFSKMKTVMIYRLPAPSCSYTAGLQLYEIGIISKCLSAGGAFVA